MVKFVITAAPLNIGVPQEILAQVHVLLKCTGSIGGDGIPAFVCRKVMHISCNYQFMH